MIKMKWIFFFSLFVAIGCGQKEKIKLAQKNKAKAILFINQDLKNDYKNPDITW